MYVPMFLEEAESHLAGSKKSLFPAPLEVRMGILWLIDC
jgi:hypothetical protein